MKTKRILRLISLFMFMAAVIFVACALSCPTCGSVFYIGSIRIGVEVWHAFYLCYVIVMVLLTVISFFIKNKK